MGSRVRDLVGGVFWNFPFSVMFYDIIQSSPETLNQINSQPFHGAANTVLRQEEKEEVSFPDKE